eukprot:TRINITY_DN16018_c0_g1_i1.p1 TRINITY_DN16018_c0_g1~~TRINITY_DN16018_c0_g1_i1.p1  ORF type:complete len:295 (-),score=47.83 TRINITY_DN16018_c0_g1_i1:43-927(-)
MSLTIALDRVDRIYRDGDKVTGNLQVNVSSGFAHSGILLEISGQVTLQLSAKSVGLFEAFYNSIKPVDLVEYKFPIQNSGKIADGKSSIPFEFDLKALAGQELFETYHGVYVNVVYTIKAQILRKYLGKNLQSSLEFIVQLPPTKTQPKVQKEEFYINPDSVEGSRKVSLPEFSIRGQIDNLNVKIDKALTGSLILEKCEEPIKCIEIQLVRVETCGCSDGFAKEATEIQNIQLVDGDIPRGIEVPIHMIFPRLFTCPTVTTARTFKIEFQVNIVLMFPDGRLVSKKYPITIIR